MLPLILPKNPKLNIDLFFILCIYSTPAYAEGTHSSPLAITLEEKPSQPL
jgi:hypothetical protein